MLEGFRKHSNSIVVKALLFLLIASFAAWGIGDMLRPAATGSAVATVGDKEVSAQQVYNDYRRQMARMTELTGGQVDDSLAQAIGESVVNDAVNRTLLAATADDMDVAISDELVVQNIHATEMFQEEGKFSRPRFEQVMFSNRLNEGQYIELVRGDLAREQVISALSSGATIPDSVVKDLYKHRQERRSADVVIINKDAIAGVEAPSEDEARKYYTDNQDQFMAPEYRKLTLLHITPKMVAANVDVPLEKIEDAYSERMSEYKKPARRTVEQMVFNSEEEAKVAVAKVAEGQTFEAVAKELQGKELADLSLGDVTKEELPEELQDAVFALGKDGVSEPIKSLFGWHVVHVSAAIEEETASFDDVKDALRDELALELAADELFGISNDVEDALGGGATIEEAAKASGFDLVSIAATDNQAKDTDGNSVALLTGQQAILDEIFAADLSAEPEMKDDGNNGYFMLRLDGITETTPRPFDVVKRIVEERVLDAKKQESAKAQADGLIEKVKSGQTLADVAAEAGLTVSKETDFTRTEANFPADVTASLFEGKVGAVATGTSNQGQVIAVLSDIKSMQGAEDQAAINALRGQLANGVVGDLQGQFVNALRTQYAVNIDRAMMNSIFTQDQQ